MLRKGVYLYEYMDEWEKLNETSLPEKYEFFRANKQNIRDTDYMYAKRVFKDFETKSFGYYHDL